MAHHGAVPDTLAGDVFRSYDLVVVFGWDDRKSERNRLERGFGFDYAARLFLGPTLTRVDGRRDYGEVRVQALGEIDGLAFVVVYTDRADTDGTGLRWIISARRARAKEIRRWRSEP